MILNRQMKDPLISLEESKEIGGRMKNPKEPNHFDLYLLIGVGVVYITLAVFVLDQIVAV